MQNALWTSPDRCCSPISWRNKGVVEFILPLSSYCIGLSLRPICHGGKAFELTGYRANNTIITSYRLLHSISPSKQPQFFGHGLYKVLKVFHRDAGPYWRQCFPRLCQVSWMSFGWGPLLIHTRNCWAWKIQQHCSSWHTQTEAPGTYYHTPFIHNPCLICLKTYTDWSGWNKWHQ
jgi:hypothetical protein